MSLIVGKKFVHNFMVNSRASNFVMPKKTVDILGLKNSHVSKGVLQLDGSTASILGVTKDIELTHHACQSLTITQYVSFINFPPFFSICLSRYFTTKVGGYLSSD